MFANRTPRPPRTQTNSQTNKRKRAQTPTCLRTIAYHGASSGRIAYACAPWGAQLSAKAALDLHRLERGGGGRRRARRRRGARARRRRARGRAAGDAAAGEPQLSRGLRHAEPTLVRRNARHTGESPKKRFLVTRSIGFGPRRNAARTGGPLRQRTKSWRRVVIFAAWRLAVAEATPSRQPSGAGK